MSLHRELFQEIKGETNFFHEFRHATFSDICSVEGIARRRKITDASQEYRVEHSEK